MPTNSQELQRIWNTQGKGNYYPIKPHQMDVTGAVVTGIEHQSNYQCGADQINLSKDLPHIKALSRAGHVSVIPTFQGRKKN